MCASVDANAQTTLNTPFTSVEKPIYSWCHVQCTNKIGGACCMHCAFVIEMIVTNLRRTRGECLTKVFEDLHQTRACHTCWLVVLCVCSRELLSFSEMQTVWGVTSGDIFRYRHFVGTENTITETTNRNWNHTQNHKNKIKTTSFQTWSDFTYEQHDNHTNHKP